MQGSDHIPGDRVQEGGNCGRQGREEVVDCGWPSGPRQPGLHAGDINSMVDHAGACPWCRTWCLENAPASALLLHAMERQARAGVHMGLLCLPMQQDKASPSGGAAATAAGPGGDLDGYHDGF
jgi:hypothetical protein